MRIVRQVSGATAILFMLTGCAVGTHTPEAISGGSLSPRQICEGSLGSAVILDWAPGTVAEFRAYQYGGPTATVPLAHAFPGMLGTARGAWCGTKEGTRCHPLVGGGSRPRACDGHHRPRSWRRRQAWLGCGPAARHGTRMLVLLDPWPGTA